MSCWLDWITLLMLISIITTVMPHGMRRHTFLCLTSPDMCLRVPIWLILKRKCLLLLVKCIAKLVVITNSLQDSLGVELMQQYDNWLLVNFVPLQEKTWIVWGKLLKENPFTFASNCKCKCLLQAEIKLKLKVFRLVLWVKRLIIVSLCVVNWHCVIFFLYLFWSQFMMFNWCN